MRGSVSAAAGLGGSAPPPPGEGAGGGGKDIKPERGKKPIQRPHGEREEKPRRRPRQQQRRPGSAGELGCAFSGSHRRCTRGGGGPGGQRGGWAGGPPCRSFAWMRDYVVSISLRWRGRKGGRKAGGGRGEVAAGLGRAKSYF